MRKYRIKEIITKGGVHQFYPQYRWCFKYSSCLDYIGPDTYDVIYFHTFKEALDYVEYLQNNDKKRRDWKTVKTIIHKL